MFAGVGTYAAGILLLMDQRYQKCVMASDVFSLIDDSNSRNATQGVVEAHSDEDHHMNGPKERQRSPCFSPLIANLFYGSIGLYAVLAAGFDCMIYAARLPLPDNYVKPRRNEVLCRRQQTAFSDPPQYSAA